MLGDGIRQVFVGGGDDPGPEGNPSGAAQTFKFLGFQHPQQLDLHIIGHIAQLIQEQRAFACQLQLSDVPFLPGAREGPAFITKKLCLHKIFGDRGAVDADKGMTADETGIVDGLGEQLLAGTALPLEQDRGIAWSDGLGQCFEAQDLTALGDDVGEMIMGRIHFCDLALVLLKTVFQTDHAAV